MWLYCTNFFKHLSQSPIKMYFLKRPRRSRAATFRNGDGYRDLENDLTSVPRHFHSCTFQPKFVIDVSCLLWSSRNLSQIFWLGICEVAPPRPGNRLWWVWPRTQAGVHDQWRMLRYKLFPIPIQPLTIVLSLEITLSMLTTGIQEMVRGWSSEFPLGFLTEPCSRTCTPSKH